MIGVGVNQGNISSRGEAYVNWVATHIHCIVSIQSLAQASGFYTYDRTFLGIEPFSPVEHIDTDHIFF